MTSYRPAANDEGRAGDGAGVGVRDRVTSVSGRAHSLQNLLPGALDVPQLEQATSTPKDAAHSLQNFAVSGFSWSQDGQRNGPPLRLPIGANLMVIYTRMVVKALVRPIAAYRPEDRREL